MLTQTGSTTSTSFSIIYAAPEQLGNKPKNNATDIWQVGVIFYELLTGEWPYSGINPWEVGDQHMQAPVQSVRQRLPFIPREVDGVIKRMLAKDPQKRFNDLAITAGALRAIEQIPLTEGEIKRTKRTQQLRNIKFHHLLLILFGLALVLMGLVFGLPML